MYNYCQHCRSTVKVVGHRKVKNVLLVISRRRIVLESRDCCQNVGTFQSIQILASRKSYLVIIDFQCQNTNL